MSKQTIMDNRIKFQIKIINNLYPIQMESCLHVDIVFKIKIYQINYKIISTIQIRMKIR